MENKKKVTILVILAVILALAAILLNVMDSDVSTTREAGEGPAGGGLVGVDIAPAPVEDRLAEAGGEAQG